MTSPRLMSASSFLIILLMFFHLGVVLTLTCLLQTSKLPASVFILFFCCLCVTPIIFPPSLLPCSPLMCDRGEDVGVGLINTTEYPRSAPLSGSGH